MSRVSVVRRRRRLASVAAHGRIPFRLRVGVTGHRHIHDPALVRTRVQAALDEIRTQFGAPRETPVVFRAISPLAEGADRIVARALLESEKGIADLEVPMPFTRARYVQDFGSSESREEFDELAGNAVFVRCVVPAANSDDEAYEQVGRWIAERCDILIAVWDGLPASGRGGTGDVARYAMGREIGKARVPIPLIVVSPSEAVTEIVGFDPDGWKTTKRWTMVKDAFRDFAVLNRDWGLTDEFAAHETSAKAEFFPKGRPDTAATNGQTSPPSDWAWVEQVGDDLLPYYVRADLLASFWQRAHSCASVGTVALATGAVICATLRSVYWPEVLAFAWAEVTLLVIILGIVLGEFWLDPRRRWISARALAERLRTLPYLTLVNPRVDVFSLEQPLRETAFEPDAAVSWHLRAFLEVWEQRPARTITDSDLPFLLRIIIGGWLEGQIAYHQQRARQHQSRHDFFHYAAFAAFALTLIAAIVSVTNHVGPTTEALAIILPAVGAALGSINAQREHRRHSRRYSLMADRLDKLKDALEVTDRLPRARQLLLSAAHVAWSENDEWLNVMNVHEVEAG
jgi:SMODS and SLOG-associating 2TM effector domain 1